MIKKINTSRMIQRLEKLQSKVESKTSFPIVLDLENWIDSDDLSSSFGEYALKVEDKNPKATIILDNMAVQTDMYVDTGLILNSDKETIKSFVNLAIQDDEVEYMKAYIELFHTWMAVDEFEIVREVISELSTPFYLDFFNHYKKLSVEELVERYKDQRFFEKQTTC